MPEERLGGLMKQKIVVFADGTGNAYSTKNRTSGGSTRRSIDHSRIRSRIISRVSARRAYAPGRSSMARPGSAFRAMSASSTDFFAGTSIRAMKSTCSGSVAVPSPSVTLIGLIGKEGLVPKEIAGTRVSNAEMKRNAMAAWRAYREKTAPDTWPTIWIARKISQWVPLACRFCLAASELRESVQRYETTEAPRHPHQVRWPLRHGRGLWSSDRGAADRDRPHDLATLFSQRVLVRESRACAPCAFARRRAHELPSAALRHDQRETDAATPPRIREVWFSGVHTDVGGGYPDGSLSYVPLVWIAGAAELASVDETGHRRVDGLRFAPKPSTIFTRAPRRSGRATIPQRIRDALPL